MTFDETLYLGDDEVDEYGDSGAYGESLEEDFEEEEEEEEEAGMPGASGRRTPQVWQQRRLPEIRPPSRWSFRSRWSWLQISSFLRRCPGHAASRVRGRKSLPCKPPMNQTQWECCRPCLPFPYQC